MLSTCVFLSKTSPEVLRDSVFVYKRSLFLLGQRTLSQLVWGERSIPPRKNRETSAPNSTFAGAAQKKGGGRKSCPIMSNHQSILVPLGLEFSRWCFIGFYWCVYPGVFWNPSKSRTCMIWVMNRLNSGLESRYSLKVLGAFCVLLYATIVFPWCFGSAYSCIMCIAIILFKSHQMTIFQGVLYTLGCSSSQPPQGSLYDVYRLYGYTDLNLPRLHLGKLAPQEGVWLRLFRIPTGALYRVVIGTPEIDR